MKDTKYLMKDLAHAGTDFCCYGVTINMAPKSLIDGRYGGYTQYDSIRKLRNAHANVNGLFVEGKMISRYTVQDNRSGSSSKSSTRSE